MAFNGDEGKQVTLTEASAWTENYRNANPTEIKAHFFGINKINSVLQQTGVMGIRFYYGQEDNGTRNLILVGTDANENDMTTGIIIETGIPCPSKCGVVNELNS